MDINDSNVNCFLLFLPEIKVALIARNDALF